MLMPDQIKWSDFQKWYANKQQPLDYEFACHVASFFDTATDLPQHLITYDWTKSFAKTQVIYYDERLNVQTLEVLQNFLRTRPCNITNLVVITSHAIGVSEWWQARCDLYQEQTFHIHEWLLCRTMTWPLWMSELEIISEQDIRLHKKIHHLFSFYGGTNPKLDRLYVSLKVRDLGSFGIVDCLTPIHWPRDQFVNHAMWLSYFQNTHEEHEIGRLYDQYVYDDHLRPSHALENLQSLPKGNPNIFSYNGYHWEIDRTCLATICNETDNMQPWLMVSEKTLIPFLHHNLVIPLAYRSVELLEQKGFWFAHDVIDYSYQFERDWLTRLNLMIQSVKACHEKLKGNYQTVFSDYFHHIRQNALLVHQHLAGDLD